MRPFYVPIFRLAICKNTHSAEYFKACNKTVFYGREQGNVYEPSDFDEPKCSSQFYHTGINIGSDNYL